MQVKKRNGQLVMFEQSKVSNAIWKAMVEVDEQDEIIMMDITDEIRKLVGLYESVGNDVMSVEAIQDKIEMMLAEKGLFKTSKAYILYRRDREIKRKKGWDLKGLPKDIYEKKYRFKDETFEEFLDRVSGGNSYIKKLMRDKKFLPAGRVLAGRGLNERGHKVVYSNCFVITPPEDNIESIFDTAKKMARTYSMGGGCGTSLENLRPNGAKVNNSAESTTGAVSFMDLYSLTTGLIGMKGRRGALMLTLPVTHPDILEFINVKNDLSKVTKANISVMINDDFMYAVKYDKEWHMKFYADTGEIIERVVPAKLIFHEISKSAWNTAEPGILYWDRVEKWHINSENHNMKYRSTNPCLTGDMRLLTKDGYKTFEELDGKEVEVINVDGDVSVGKVWYTGEKETLTLTLSNGKTIKSTPDHRFQVVGFEEVEAQYLKGKKIRPYTEYHKKFNEEFIKYGFIQGDGALGRLLSNTHKGLEVNIGENDGDILGLFEGDQFTISNRKIYLQGDYKEKLLALEFDNKSLPTRVFPKTYNDWSLIDKASFLQGCYSANGSVITNYRVAYKTTSLEFANELMETLKNDFGIDSYMTTNKSKKVQFDNGVYTCRESYDVNIGKYDDLQKFHLEIGFYHNYKKEALSHLLKTKVPYVQKIESNGRQKVYDFNEPKTNWGVVEGFITHNCGEKPLPEGGSCMLASFNFSEYVLNPFTEYSEFDFDSFTKDVPEVVTFMDDLLEEGIKYLPLQEQIESAKDYRQLGIGVMGLADALIKLGIKYGSRESLEFISEVMDIMINESVKQSSLLAKERGSYRAFDKELVLRSPFVKEVLSREVRESIRENGLRNAELLSIAPTGSLSSMWEISGGIEPIFATHYTRKSESLGEDGEPVYYNVYTSIVEEYMLLNDLKNISELPDYFVTAMTLNSLSRIKVQSIMQYYVDSAISSTINLPEDTKVEDIEKIYMMAWEHGLKGITIYRDGCARGGILTTGDTKKKSTSDQIDELKEQMDKLIVQALEENPETCPMCGGHLQHSGGCETCVDCGYSPCSI